MLYKMSVKHFFDASHQLPDSENLITKACARLHGHTYAVIVEYHANPKDLRGGMIFDFKAIKNVIDILDHRHINDIFRENGYVIESTAENIARFLFEQLKERLNKAPICIKVCEGYKGEERASWVSYGGEE